MMERAWCRRLDGTPDLSGRGPAGLRGGGLRFMGRLGEKPCGKTATHISSRNASSRGEPLSQVSPLNGGQTQAFLR